jgi:N-acetylmuramoyl-L-alanine amidase
MVALVALALAGLLAAGCGSDEKAPTTKPPALSAATANQLATLSEQIATDLDAGDTCDAAQAADELQSAVDGADLSTALRPGVEEVASRLVNEVNCPPPPPAPEPEEKDKTDEQSHDDKQKSGGIEIPIPPGHGGEPPGQAKIHGEDE